MKYAEEYKSFHLVLVQIIRQEFNRKYASGQTEMARRLDKGVDKTAGLFPVCGVVPRVVQRLNRGSRLLIKLLLLCLLTCGDT